MSRLFRAAILGAPASGKGTISSRIVKAFNLEHLSSGDKIRLNIQAGTKLGLEAQQYIKQGQLVPNELMINFITQEIGLIGNKSWLLDGFPRTLPQAESLWHVQKLDLVVNLVVPFEVIIDRVKGRRIHLPSGRVYNVDFNAPKVAGKDDLTGEPLVQRDDDKPDVVQKRLMAYDEVTQPLIQYYKKLGILKEFHGRTSDEIWPKVKACLSEHLPTR